MYNKIFKRVASVLGAALMLGCVVTSVIPAQAATSTKVGDNYETSYSLSDFELIYSADTATISGSQIEWTDRYGNIFYKIPQEVMDAGVVGFKCTGTTTDTVDLKIANADDIWATALVDKYTDTFDGAVAEIDASQRASATAFCIMSCSAEAGTAMSATVNSVIFITANPVGDVAAGGEEPKTEDAPEAAAPSSSKTGESLTTVYVVCALGGLLLIAAAGMFVTEQKKRR